MVFLITLSGFPLISMTGAAIRPAVPLPFLLATAVEIILHRMRPFTTIPLCLQFRSGEKESRLERLATRG